MVIGLLYKSESINQEDQLYEARDVVESARSVLETGPLLTAARSPRAWARAPVPTIRSPKDGKR